MYKIGEFSEMCGISVPALRYYDSLGLITPTYIDYFTNYRYYDNDNLLNARRLAVLKDAGLSLDEIKRYINGGVDIATIIDTKTHELSVKIEKLADVKQKLYEEEIKLKNNPDTQFTDDPRIIGKWQLKEQSGGMKIFDYLYFLPGGKQWWCYSWTKGYIIYNSGMNEHRTYRYEIDDDILSIHMNDAKYVMQRIDNKAYDISETRTYDNTDLPFVTDERVIGKWNVCGFTDSPNSSSDYNMHLFWQSVTFKEGGICTVVYDSGEFTLAWTNGYVLNRAGGVAEKYTIYGDRLYIEWKNGDVVFAGYNPKYYVFRKAN
jgi:DNA-binding transcriptional MerR regulator